MPNANAPNLTIRTDTPPAFDWTGIRRAFMPESIIRKPRKSIISLLQLNHANKPRSH